MISPPVFTDPVHLDVKPASRTSGFPLPSDATSSRQGSEMPTIRKLSLRSDSCQLPKWPTNGRSFQGKTPSQGECLRQTRDTATERSPNYYEIWI
jgi:hypothetical protein